MLQRLCLIPTEATEHLDSKGLDMASPSGVPATRLSSRSRLPERTTFPGEEYLSPPKHLVNVLSEADTLGAPVPMEERLAHAVDNVHGQGESQFASLFS